MSCTVLMTTKSFAWFARQAIPILICNTNVMDKFHHVVNARANTPFSELGGTGKRQDHQMVKIKRIWLRRSTLHVKVTFYSF